MWRYRLLMAAWLFSACASTVQPTDGAAQDALNSDGAFTPDSVLADRGPLDASGHVDSQVAAPDTLDAPDTNAHRDAGAEMHEAGFFDDVEIQNAECNDLLPTVPMRGVMRDGQLSGNLAGGQIRDGLYRLIRLELYRRVPGDPNPPAWFGQSLRIVGNRWQWAAMVSGVEDVMRGATLRGNCTFSTRSDGTEPVCLLTCPARKTGGHAFGPYEVRGNELVFFGGTILYVFSRVGDP